MSCWFAKQLIDGLNRSLKTGPGVGAALFSQGGFMLPFLVVGGISTTMSISLAFTIPNLSDTPSDTPPQGSQTIPRDEQQQLR